MAGNAESKRSRPGRYVAVGAEGYVGAGVGVDVRRAADPEVVLPAKSARSVRAQIVAHLNAAGCRDDSEEGLLSVRHECLGGHIIDDKALPWWNLKSPILPRSLGASGTRPCSSWFAPS